MDAASSARNSGDSFESHAKQAGAVFGRDVAQMLKNWQGPATIATLAGYVASRIGMPIGNTQLSVGLAMVTAGAVAEAVSTRQQHPEMDLRDLEKKTVKEWARKLQGPSHVSFIVGMIGMLKKIKGSEAAFIAGAIGAVINMISTVYDNIMHPSAQDAIQR